MIAALLYAVSAALIMRLYVRSQSEFLYWYALGLALLAVGLLTLLLAQTPDNSISWTGRVAQMLCLGCVPKFWHILVGA